MTNNIIKEIIRYAYFSGFYRGISSYKEVLANFDQKPLSKTENEAYEEWEKETIKGNLERRLEEYENE